MVTWCGCRRVQTSKGPKRVAGAAPPEPKGANPTLGASRNATNPRAGSGMQQARRACAEQAVEVVRNHGGGTRWSGWPPLPEAPPGAGVDAQEAEQEHASDVQGADFGRGRAPSPRLRGTNGRGATRIRRTALLEQPGDGVWTKREGSGPRERGAKVQQGSEGSRPRRAALAASSKGGVGDGASPRRAAGKANDPHQSVQGGTTRHRRVAPAPCMSSVTLPRVRAQPRTPSACPPSARPLRAPRPSSSWAGRSSLGPGVRVFRRETARRVHETVGRSPPELRGQAERLHTFAL
jgi:hypothetical protein